MRSLSTLLPGREPLISRYTRFDFGHLPPDCAGYTRFLTLLWAALLAGFAAAQAAALAGLWTPVRRAGRGGRRSAAPCSSASTSCAARASRTTARPRCGGPSAPCASPTPRGDTVAP